MKPQRGELILKIFEILSTILFPKRLTIPFRMSHHFVQQLIHVMWSTRDQKFFISEPVRRELYAYLSSVIKSKEGHLLLAGGSSDHVHCLISMPPKLSLSNLMQSIKSFSSKWIKSKSEIDPQFSWQDGYTAISLQEDRKESVYSYIKNEEERHRKMGFKKELEGILTLQGIPINEHYFLENSHSKVLIHLIWSTKGRIPYIKKSIRPSLYTELSRVIKENKGTTHAIGGIEDHVHVLIEMPKDKALSDLVRETKAAGTNFISHHEPSFEWQTGFGAFSISLSTLDAAKKYIQNQEEHHRTKTTSDEWDLFISKKGILHF